MFIDKVNLTVSSGKGGAGCVSFRQEKFVLKGGPDGGDGGRGGDVYFVVDKNSHTLSSFRGQKQLKAKGGVPGQGSRMTGKKGESLYIKVPPGTQVVDNRTEELLYDLLEDGEQVLFVEGGKGGLGNWHFKSSTTQKPRYAQPGLPGVDREIRLEIKMIADVGLVGFPNVGKSTLIATISNARPEVANYEFTTLTPKLGVVEVDSANSFVMADIPGIIEGASDGRGLGLEFLKHIERTEFLLYMIDLANYRDLHTQFTTLRAELKKYSQTLGGQAYAIALTRVDAVYDENIEKTILDFIESLGFKQSEKRFDASDDYPFYFAEEEDIEKPKFILPISAVSRINVRSLVYALNAGINGEDSFQSW